MLLGKSIIRGTVTLAKAIDHAMRGGSEAVLQTNSQMLHDVKLLYNRTKQDQFGT